LWGRLQLVGVSPHWFAHKRRTVKPGGPEENAQSPPNSYSALRWRKWAIPAVQIRIANAAGLNPEPSPWARRHEFSPTTFLCVSCNLSAVRALSPYFDSRAALQQPLHRGETARFFINGTLLLYVINSALRKECSRRYHQKKNYTAETAHSQRLLRPADFCQPISR
jgi:hypothetical protein